MSSTQTTTGVSPLSLVASFLCIVVTIAEARIKMLDATTPTPTDQPTLNRMWKVHEANAFRTPSEMNIATGGAGEVRCVDQEGNVSSSSGSSSSSAYPPCDPQDVNLSDYPQWRDEVGYWIGEYSFYDGNGEPYASESWNYPYDTYKGFITGNVQGNAYRQRNVFLYPPQRDDRCHSTNNTVVGEGKCGVHGNAKVFSADQSATTCSDNPALGGTVEGPYEDVFYTTTELVGRARNNNNNAVLYQVWLDKDAFDHLEEDQIFQSQLTTITRNPDTGEVRRTRTAQGFAFHPAGEPRSASFYRERRVDKETFYAELNKFLIKYNILKSDVCAWKNDCSTGLAVRSGYEPGFDGCREHLEQSFDL